MTRRPTEISIHLDPIVPTLHAIPWTRYKTGWTKTYSDCTTAICALVLDGEWCVTDMTKPMTDRRFKVAEGQGHTDALAKASATRHFINAILNVRRKVA